MAQVGTPRFYVSVLQWLKSLGKIDIGDVVGTDFEIGANKQEALSLLDLNPAHTKVGASLPDGVAEVVKYITDAPIASYTYEDQGFAMLLNHNFKSAGANWLLKEDIGAHFGNQNQTGTINYSLATNSVGGGDVEYDGWSLVTADDINQFSNESTIKLRMQESSASGANLYGDSNLQLGCFALGNYWDPPHSPDLNLTLMRDYSNIKTIETKSGASLSNDFGSSPPKWGDRAAWQLGDQDFSTGGRRLWSLSFSFLSDSSVFPDNPTEIADGGGWEVDDTTPDFISEVLKKCNGGQLPFIFQPNTDENIFAICKFDQNSFSFQQTAPNLYSVKMKIREVW